MCDDSFHEWKIISLRLIKNVFCDFYRIHSNLVFKRHVKSFPYYYRDILLIWKRYLLQKPEVPSCILSQNLWYIHIQIDKEPYPYQFSGKKRYELQGETYFQWVQLIRAISRPWEDIIKQNTNNADNRLTHNQHKRF